MITIKIKTGNAAFHQGDFATGCEIARILRRMADEFEQDGFAYNPRDINGNVVGTVKITKD